ncbi:MAG: hypothetical protein JO353_00165, partial [Phycisphaerae bacterium]|nr:hypothetical protein [Phycisphaerae bacterium]
MKFNYTAFNMAGAQSGGAIDANSITEAQEALRRQGLFVVTLDDGEQAVHSSAERATQRVGAGKRLKNVSAFARQMHALISSGTALVQGLTAIERQCEDARWKSVVADLRERVE